MKKKTQSTLSESLLRATLYSIGDAVIATDTRRRVTLMNPVAEKLTGWKEREARGKALSTVFRIVNEETRKKVESPVERVLREGIVVGLANHTILISRNGKESAIADAGAPIKDENGKVVGVVLVFRDQTAERTAQRAVQDAREFAESIIATVREPLLVLDEKLEVVSANRSFYNVFKVKHEETIGKRIYRLGNGQWNIPALRKLLEDILPSNSHFDDYEVTHDFEHIGRRTMLLNARRLFREANRSKLILLAIEDITERKQAELQLRQILHNTTNLFYSHTPEHVLTYVSPQSKHFLGCDPEEAKRRWTDFATDHPVNRMGYELTERAIKTGKPQPPYELQLKKKTGEIIWVEVREVPVVEGGTVTAIVGALTDITERKRAEKALKESEERYHRISDLTSDYAYAFRVEDGNRLIREWETDSFTRITGYTPQEVDERGGWPSLIHPDDMPIALARAKRLFSGEDDVSEFRIIRKDGQSRWLRDHAHPVWDGKQQRVVRIYGAAQDITEQKKAEQAVREREEWFRRLADTTSTAIFIYQGERFVYANKATEELSGYTNQELLSQRFWDVVHPDFRELVRERGLARQRGEAVPNRYEFPIVRKDSTARWIDFTAGKIDWQGQPAAIGTAFDITERKLVEQALRENEQRYRSIVENINQAYYEADRRGIFTYCNPGLLIISGYSAEELLGTVSYRLIADEDRRKVIAQYERWLKEKRTDMAMEFRVQTKSGRIFWVEQVTHVEFDEQGNFVKATNVLRDIDERKRAEETLRQSEQKYRQLFESANDAIMIFEPEGEVILDVNRKACEVYGFTREELIGMSLKAISTDVPRGEERIRRVLQEGVLVNFESVHKTKSGAQINVLISGSVIEYEGRRAILSIHRDITERKKVEQQLEEQRALLSSIFEASRDGILLEDEHEMIAYVNTAYAHIFGYDRPEELIGRPVSVVQSEKDDQRMRDYARKRLRGEPAPSLYEFTGVRKDGTSINLEVSVAVAELGARKYIISVLRDVGERKRAEAERKRLEQQLYQAQKLESIGTLASGIAHDFNNILAIIMGHASLLEQLHDDRHKLAKRAETILKATERGASLVKQLLTFARKAERVLEPFDVNLLIREMGKMLRETFPRDIELQLHLEKDLPAIVVDANQLHQVVLNLCVNARDAMPNGGTLTIATARVKAEALSHRFPNVAAREYLTLTISDTGVGIDPQIRDRIIEPFFTTKAPGHGTGLGLAVVHGIVSSHGGFIDVESEVGKGTVFSLYFPIPERPVQLSPVASVEAETVRGGTETILLVEDEEMLRTMLVTLLESKGYRVLTASDGEEGFELYQRHRQNIQLVLSDFGLSKLNGAELFRRVKALDPRARVILASGFFEPQLRVDLEQQGVAHLLSKPYSAVTVLSVVRNVLDSSSEAARHE